MILKLNEQYDIFVEAARHIHKTRRIQRAKKQDLESYPPEYPSGFEYPHYMGFEKGASLKARAADVLFEAGDYLWFGCWGKISEKSFVEACLSEFCRLNFFEEFVSKNQKLWK